MPAKSRSSEAISTARFSGRKVVVAITGGIAAYKTCLIVRELIRQGAEVQVVMSRAAKEFVTPLTFATLSGRPVLDEMFPAESPTNPLHLTPASWGEVLIVAPATADYIGKLAHGLADDVPSTIGMAFRGPILLAPAMNPKMWSSPAVQENIQTLHRREVLTVGPESGAMGGVLEEAGVGRMSEPESILDRLEEILSVEAGWKAVSILITSGPTREALDPVRFISNRSSGKMGDAIARAAAVRGASVTMIRGIGSTSPIPNGVEVVNVESAAEMATEFKSRFAEAQIAILAAAVADWTIETVATQKLKKDAGPPQAGWKPTEDILAWAGANKKKQVVVGFALETEDHLSRAQQKLSDKHADMIVLNDATRPDSTFGGDFTCLTLVTTSRKETVLPQLNKRSAALEVLNAARRLLKR